MRKALLILSIMVAASLFNTMAFAAIVNDEVTSIKLKEADGTASQDTNSGSGVKTGHIQNNAVTTIKILDSAITTTKIANGAVTDAKISGLISASKISSTGLNADTVDGLHATAFATASHTQAMSTVTGLDAALAGKSDVTHNHDTLYQQKYGKVAVVAQTGGDYTSPLDAMNNVAAWCGTPSAANPCSMKIMPGVYDLGGQSLVMNEYVDIEGSGENTTVITGTNVTRYPFYTGTVTTANNAELRFLTVTNTGSDPNTGNYFFAIFNNHTSPRITHVTASSVGNSYARSAIASNYSSAIISHVKAFAGGTNTDTTTIRDYNSNITLLNSDVQASGDGSICIGHAADGPYAQGQTIANSTITASGCSRVMGVENSSSSPTFLKNVVVTASAGKTENVALYFLGLKTVSISEVSAVAKDGLTSNTGLYGNWQEITIERSTIEGNIANSGYPLKIGASKLIGTISGGPNTCAASYNGNFAPLSSTCQ